MRRRINHALSVTQITLATLAALLVSSMATAGPIHVFGEVLTSTALSGPASNVRAQLDLNLDMTANDILAGGSITQGDGIGSGFVSGSQSVTFTHRFRPAAVVSSILSASLFVTTADDSWFDGHESVAISLDQQFWASGGATLRVFGGRVSASLFQSDGEAIVSVRSTRGDVNVVASLFKVVYDAGAPGGGGGTSAVPEPGAMALFCAGLGVVGIVKRRRA